MEEFSLFLEDASVSAADHQTFEWWVKSFKLSLAYIALGQSMKARGMLLNITNTPRTRVKFGSHEALQEEELWHDLQTNSISLLLTAAVPNPEHPHSVQQLRELRMASTSGLLNAHIELALGAVMSQAANDPENN